MRNFLVISFFILSFLYASANPAFAGGGHFETDVAYGTHYFGDLVDVSVKFWENDYSAGRPNNNIELRILNPKDGDKCYMTQPVTDSQGMAYGKCTSKSTSPITVYPYWYEGNDDGSQVVIYFQVMPTPQPTLSPTAKPQAPTSVPTPAVTATPNIFLATPTESSTPTSTPRIANDSGFAQTPKANIFTIIWQFILSLFYK